MEHSVADDVLIYNRVGRRRIVNVPALVEQLLGHGLATSCDSKRTGCRGPNMRDDEKKEVDQQPLRQQGSLIFTQRHWSCGYLT